MRRSLKIATTGLFVVSICLTLVWVSPSIILFGKIEKPLTESFATSTTLVPYSICTRAENSFPCDVGNITVVVGFTTVNPAGLSSGNPFDVKISVRFTENFSEIPASQASAIAANLTGASEVAGGYPTSAPAQLIPLSTKTDCYKVGGSDCGYLWEGSGMASYSSYGEEGMFLEFGSQSTSAVSSFSSGYGYSVPPFIQVLPPINTLQYLDTNILIALEVLVILLIAVEIVRGLLPAQPKKYDYDY